MGSQRLARFCPAFCPPTYMGGKLGSVHQPQFLAGNRRHLHPWLHAQVGSECPLWPVPSLSEGLASILSPSPENLHHHQHLLSTYYVLGILQ